MPVAAEFDDLPDSLGSNKQERGTARKNPEARMSIVIHVHDDLARRLQSAAENQNVTAEDLAVRILDGAVSQASRGGD